MTQCVCVHPYTCDFRFAPLSSHAFLSFRSFAVAFLSRRQNRADQRCDRNGRNLPWPPTGTVVARCRELDSRCCASKAARENPHEAADRGFKSFSRSKTGSRLKGNSFPCGSRDLIFMDVLENAKTVLNEVKDWFYLVLRLVGFA